MLYIVIDFFGARLAGASRDPAVRVLHRKSVAGRKWPRVRPGPRPRRAGARQCPPLPQVGRGRTGPFINRIDVGDPWEITCRRRHRISPARPRTRASGAMQRAGNCRLRRPRSSRVTQFRETMARTPLLSAERTAVAAVVVRRL